MKEIIVSYKESDAKQLVSLFYDTVHSINPSDYSKKQLDAWAPIEAKTSTLESWKESLSGNITFVAKTNEIVVGFGDMTYKGYLDRLYVHKNYQRQGIATSIVEMLEIKARQLHLSEIRTDASITAKPFFEHLGYEVVCSQVVERAGVELINYIMIKNIK